jgi:hypothetical protein
LPNQCGRWVSNSATSPVVRTRSWSPSTRRSRPSRTYSHWYPSCERGSGSRSVGPAGRTRLSACSPPGLRVSGMTVMPLWMIGWGCTRGPVPAGAPTSSSSGIWWALARGNSSSRPGLRCPDSSRDRVLTGIPVVSDRAVRVAPLRRRSSRSRGPTAASTASNSSLIRSPCPRFALFAKIFARASWAGAGWWRRWSRGHRATTSDSTTRGMDDGHPVLG